MDTGDMDGPWWIIAAFVSVTVGSFRVFGMTGSSFQAGAHLLVGLLIGLAIGRRNWSWAFLAIALCAVEVLMFFASMYGAR